METLHLVVNSMQAAAQEAGVHIIAGDTKVVEHGKADGIFITTAGIGFIPDGMHIGGQLAQPGDVVLVSGTMGDHGIAVLSARGDLGFQAQVESDVAPLNHLIRRILDAAPNTHVYAIQPAVLATTLNEIAVQSGVCIKLEEAAIPVKPVVQSACEMLGFDPLYVANEGKVIVILPPDQVDAALAAMHRLPYGAEAAAIGVVKPGPARRSLDEDLHRRHTRSGRPGRRNAAAHLLSNYLDIPCFQFILTHD